MSKEKNNMLLSKINEYEKRMNEGQENTINMRKQKLFKRTQLINTINNYYKKNNFFNNIFKNYRKKPFTKTINNSNIIKINSIDENKSKFSERIKKENNKRKIAHLYIDSYNNKLSKLYLHSDPKTKINNKIKNKTFTYFLHHEKQKNIIKQNLRNLKMEILNKNKGKKRINGRANSISFNELRKTNEFFNLLRLSTNLKNKNKSRRSQIYFNSLKINNENQNKKLKFKKTKLCNNFIKNIINSNILNNSNLKILYQTDENRIKRMIKSQSKQNKNKYSIIKYQKNLLENSISPLTNEQKFKLTENFKKLNNSIKVNKKTTNNIYKYLKEIQKKEKKIINYHNKVNDGYIKRIQNLGLSPEKYRLKIERAEFKDVFEKLKL
jgi:hypothetical protein